MFRPLRAQNSDTRRGSWVMPFSPLPRMRIHTYRRHNNPPQYAKQPHLVENQVVTLSPAQRGPPRSSGTPQISPPAYFTDCRVLCSLTSRGKLIISILSWSVRWSIYSIFFLHFFFFLLCFFFFTFSRSGIVYTVTYDEKWTRLLKDLLVLGGTASDSLV